MGPIEFLRAQKKIKKRFFCNYCGQKTCGTWYNMYKNEKIARKVKNRAGFLFVKNFIKEGENDNTSGGDIQKDLQPRRNGR